MDNQQIFESAFADTNNTAIDTPAADINKILHSGVYKVDPNFTYTHTQLWDMEDKKAHHPDQYLRRVLRPGSLEIFGVTKNGPLERFTRITDQRTWKDPTKFTKVIEQVLLDHDAKRAFFIGVPEVDAPDGRKIVAGKEQPLFHVEHSTTGTENKPVNIWRIVHLDTDESGELRALFKGMSESPYLREFIEVHIREELGEELVRL